MPVFTFNSPENTYLQSVTGGTISADVAKDVITQWVAALEPRETPILTKVMSNDEFGQEVHKWGQSFRMPTRSTLAATATNVATTITVATGQGVRFQIGSVVRVYTPLVGTDAADETTLENMLVTARAGDVLTVTRGFGTTAYARAVGDVVEIVGTAEAQNSEHTEAPRMRGIQLFNYPQRFQAKLTADKRVQNMETWEDPTNSLLADFEEEMLKQKELLERAFFHGKRVAGDGTKPSAMGGLNQFLTTNSINMAAAKVSGNTLDNVIADLYLKSDLGQLSIVCNMNTARILDMTIDPTKRQVQIEGDTYNKIIRTYHFRTGTFTVEPTRNVPDGSIYILDLSRTRIRPFKGLNWHVSGRKGEDFAVDQDVKAISGDFTLEVLGEHTMARIYNFEGRLAQYP